MQSLKINILIPDQRLALKDAATGRTLASYPISTSAFGTGSEPGSYRTPTGHFCIAEKIGHGAPLGAVFESRRMTGERAAPCNPADERDRITTRILWLHGLEPHNANTRDRYIYLHGTNHEEAIGRPVSHGCIRMRNADIAALFEQVEPGTEVWIA